MGKKKNTEVCNIFITIDVVFTVKQHLIKNCDINSLRVSALVSMSVSNNLPRLGRADTSRV